MGIMNLEVFNVNGEVLEKIPKVANDVYERRDILGRYQLREGQQCFEVSGY
jgi:hypothetical protein